MSPDPGIPSQNHPEGCGCRLVQLLARVVSGAAWLLRAVSDHPANLPLPLECASHCLPNLLPDVRPLWCAIHWISMRKFLQAAGTVEDGVPHSRLICSLQLDL